MTRLITTGRVLAILCVLVGIVHEAMTFHPIISDGFHGLDAMWQRTFTYVSLGCGGLVMLCGFLFLMLLPRVERHEFLTAPLVTIGVFATANGILAVCFMLANPFAWVVAAFGIGLFAVSMFIRSKHKKR